jgi:hypothetical protein
MDLQDRRGMRNCMVNAIEHNSLAFLHWKRRVAILNCHISFDHASCERNVNLQLNQPIQTRKTASSGYAMHQSIILYWNALLGQQSIGHSSLIARMNSRQLRNKTIFGGFHILRKASTPYPNWRESHHIEIPSKIRQCQAGRKMNRSHFDGIPITTSQIMPDNCWRIS